MSSHLNCQTSIELETAFFVLVALLCSRDDVIDDRSGVVVEVVDAETLPGEMLESGSELVEALPLVGMERYRVGVAVVVSGLVHDVEVVLLASAG